MRVLIVEDEPDVADLVARTIREGAWAADVVSTGVRALEMLRINDYDLMVLDVGLPDIDGLEVCRRWRRVGGRTPILMLTARGSLGERVVGLDAGADDYLTKPFAIEELSARLRALARRPRSGADVQLALADLDLDPATRTVRRAGIPLRLTAREYALLEYLLRNPRRVVSRSQIIEHIWDDAFDPIGNVVEVLVGRVRRRIDRPGLTPLLHTVRGHGYMLSDRPPANAD